jgi:hypothetical protein
MYNITKGQLIVIWCVGAIICNSSWSFFANTQVIIEWMIPVPLQILAAAIFVLLPFVLLFYTLGWRNYHKKAKGN